MTKREKEENGYLVGELIKEYTNNKSTPNGTVGEIRKLINPTLSAINDTDRQQIEKDIIKVFDNIMEKVDGFKNRFRFKNNYLESEGV